MVFDCGGVEDDVEGTEVGGDGGVILGRACVGANASDVVSVGRIKVDDVVKRCAKRGCGFIPS